MKRLLRGFVSVLGGDVVRFVANILITPFLVRLLTTEQYGTYVFLIAIFEVSYLFANAGLTDSVRKFIAEKRDVIAWRARVVGFVFRAAAGLLLVLLCLVFLSAEFGLVRALFDGVVTQYLSLLAVMLIVHQLFLLSTDTLMGLSLEQYSEPIRSLQRILFGVIAVPLAYEGYGVEGVLWSHIASSLVVGGITLAVLARRLDLRHALGRLPPAFPAREILQFNVSTFVFQLLFRSFYYVDVILVHAFLGGESTAYYKAAVIVAELLWLVPSSLQNFLLHSVSDLWRENETDVISNLSSRILRYVLGFSVLSTIGLFVLADELVVLYYSPTYTPAINLLLILLPGALFFSLAKPLLSIIQAKGELRPLLVATGAAAALNLALNVALIPAVGVLGAALATTVGYSLLFPFSLWAAGAIGVELSGDLRLDGILRSGLGTGVVLVALDHVLASTVAALLVIPVVGFLLYVVLAFRTRLLTPDEIDGLFGTVPTRVEKSLRYISR